MRAAVCLALCLTGISAQTPPEAVPPKYAAVFAQYKAALEKYDAYLERMESRPGSTITFGAELLAANANQGPALLEPLALETARMTLDRFKELGLGGVTVNIGYPVLTDEVDRAGDYLAFYKRIAGLVRERGMRLAVKLHVLFSGTAFSRLRVDFSGLTVDHLGRGKRLMAERVLQEMQPAYLTLGGEPDTEAALTGLPELGRPEVYAAMVASILKDLPRGRTLIGAGQGTWVSPAFAEAYAKLDVDFINIHVYPLNRETVANTERIGEIARKNGKRLILDECWFYKIFPGEKSALGAGETIFRRDAYGFWAPLDELFLKTMAKLAAVQGIEYVSPFWSNCFFAALDYSPRDENLPFDTHRRKFNQAVFRNLRAGVFTRTGRFYAELIKRFGR